MSRLSRMILMCALVLFAAMAGELRKISPALSEIRPLTVRGLDNVFQIGTKLFSGSAPEGPDAFKALRRLGIKSIITVDGTRPDVEEAHKHGLTYVHLPHGYDGIPRATQVLLVKASETMAGPIYVHCHHGKHRGPAAVAVICEAQFGWTPEQGIAWMRRAGTATNYAGLYRTAESFRAPTVEELNAAASKFPEVAKISGLVDAMVAIDNRMDLLKAIRSADFKTPPAHPDLAPANEALLLKEAFRELQRLPEAQKRGVDFLDGLKDAEMQAGNAEKLLVEKARGDGSLDNGKLRDQFSAIEKRCASCHEKFRN